MAGIPKPNEIVLVDRTLANEPIKLTAKFLTACKKIAALLVTHINPDIVQRLKLIPAFDMAVEDGKLHYLWNLVKHKSLSPTITESVTMNSMIINEKRVLSAMKQTSGVSLSSHIRSFENQLLKLKNLTIDQRSNLHFSIRKRKATSLGGFN